MSINYSIPAIPTMYRGRQYRSRLEARWAAFFATLRWPAEYEPLDLGQWSPDFLLQGIAGTILAEVKPINEFDQDTATKITVAADAANFHGELLLLGLTPGFHDETHVFTEYGDKYTIDHTQRLGWLNDRKWGGGNEFAWACFAERCHKIDFCHGDGCLDGRIFGGSITGLRPSAAELRYAWSEACNAVQYKPSASAKRLSDRDLRKL